MGQLLVLGGAGDRDRVEDQRGFAGQHLAIVRRRIPGQHLGGLALLVQRLDELDRLQRVLGTEHDIAVGVLNAGAERIHDGAHRHRGVELRRQPNAEGNAGLVLDLLAADADVVPGVRLHADLAPQVRAVVDRVGDEAVGEGEVLLGLRVVGALDGEIDRLAVPLRALVVDLLHVDDLVLVNRGRRQEHHQVVPLLGRHLGSGTRGDQRQVDVVDRDRGIVLLAPFLDVFALEPGVIGRDEMAPLQDFQSVCSARRRDVKEGADTGHCAGSHGGLDHVAA
jgi:hypothetical protein